jgi:decaprenylphospho-beta-D-erythro-pentofuranosid-2-ulose 2-reductase
MSTPAAGLKVVFLGATKGMGRALAGCWRSAAIGCSCSVATRRTSSAARRTCRRAGAAARWATRLRPGDPSGFAAALDAADAALGGFDTVVVTAALFATQDQLEADLERTRELLVVDFANTVVFCEHARQRLLARGGGTLCVFSSVAGDRGRKPVILYGAAKAGLSHYLEGLDHKFRARGLRTICVKPGFVKTGMTEGLKPPPFAGEPEGVAATVLRAIDRGTPMVYTPGIWAHVMRAIRWLPRFVMRKINF